MDEGARGGPRQRPFARDLRLWRDFPGAAHPDDPRQRIREPRQLVHARRTLGLLERFPGYTLTTLLAEDTLLLRLLAIEALGTPDDPDETVEGGDTWPETT